MHRLFRIKAYEAEHGPHFDEEMARKAVSKMENEDGSRGQHWSIEETTSLANQHGIRMDEKFNKYDWYVALNMVYSDYYRVVVNMTNSNNPKHFVELAKAWLCDKDSIAKCDEEMKRCQDLLDKLDIKPEEKEDPRIKELQNEVSELKNIIKQASQMVSAPMKQMLPQDMQNAMNEASH